MAKYLKCLNNIDVENYLKVGEEYELINVDVEGNYQIKTEHNTYWFLPSRFDPVKISSEVEPITFTSQEDFENAVMAAVMKRLSIHSHDAYIQVGDFGSAPECSL